MSYTLQQFRAICTIDPITECWLWPTKPKDGRVTVERDGKTVMAYRVTYELKFGPIPKGKDCALHCDGQSYCINPDHRKLGDPEDRLKLLAARGRTLKGIRRSVLYRGDRSHHAKLDWPKVRTIRERLANERADDLATEYGVDHATICRIGRYDTWKEGFAA